MSCNGVHVYRLHNIMCIRNVYTQLVSMTCLHVLMATISCKSLYEYIYVYQHPTKLRHIGVGGVWVEPVATSNQPYNNIIFLPFN